MNTKNPIIVGAIAAALSVCGTGAFADDMVTTTTTTTTSWSAPTYTPSVPLSSYVLLNKKRNYDYIDLAQAKAEGYSNREVAKMAKISDKSGQPFSQIRILANAGYSLGSIAEMFNGNVNDINHVDEYENNIREYKVAYENTGWNSARSLIAGSQETYDTTKSTTTMVSPTPAPAAPMNPKQPDSAMTPAPNTNPNATP